MNEVTRPSKEMEKVLMPSTEMEDVGDMDETIIPEVVGDMHAAEFWVRRNQSLFHLASFQVFTSSVSSQSSCTTLSNDCSAINKTNS